MGTFLSKKIKWQKGTKVRSFIHRLLIFELRIFNYKCVQSFNKVHYPIKDMYDNVVTSVRTSDGDTNDFSINIRLH
jgi:hypothetical protein